jgi:hypothetical protein
MYSPFDSEGMFLIPRDRREINAWSRHYVNVSPIISTYIDDIASGVLGGGFKLFCSSPKEQALYRTEFFDKHGDFRLLPQCLDFVRELNMIGEVFPNLILNEKKNIVSFQLLNPDFIEVRKNSLVGKETLYMIPDNELRRLVASTKPKDVKLVKELGVEMVNCIKNDRSIPLDSSQVKHIMLKVSSQDIRGTSSVLKYFKVLMYEDKVLEEAFRLGFGKPNFVFIKQAVGSEVMSKSFENKLYTHRRLLEDYLTDVVFKSFGNMNGLKSPVRITWNEDIDLTEIRKNWK